MRDERGQEVVVSSGVGVEAWKRFGVGMILPLGVCGIIYIAAIGIFWWRHKRRCRV